MNMKDYYYYYYHNANNFSKNRFSRAQSDSLLLLVSGQLLRLSLFRITGQTTDAILIQNLSMQIMVHSHMP